MTPSQARDALKVTLQGITYERRTTGWVNCDADDDDCSDDANIALDALAAMQAERDVLRAVVREWDDARHGYEAAMDLPPGSELWKDAERRLDEADEALRRLAAPPQDNPPSAGE